MRSPIQINIPKSHCRNTILRHIVPTISTGLSVGSSRKQIGGVLPCSRDCLFAVCSSVCLSPDRTTLTAVSRADDLDNTRFEGIVRDPDGAVISGATVVAIHTATGVERSTLTGADGRYRISVNATGAYKLKAAASGFKEDERNQIEVTSGRTVAIDFAISPAGASEEVTVVGSATA